jgi:hypothetical protein
VGGTCGTHGEEMGIYGVLVGRPGWKRPLGRPKRRWEDNIEIYLMEIWNYGANLIFLAQDWVQCLAF